MGKLNFGGYFKKDFGCGVGFRYASVFIGFRNSPRVCIRLCKLAIEFRIFFAPLG